jgi:hypothetical protein
MWYHFGQSEYRCFTGLFYLYPGAMLYKADKLAVGEIEEKKQKKRKRSKNRR